MIYTVVVESSARKDIDQAYRWIVKNISKQTASLWYLDIYGAMESLKTFPARCALAPENQFFKEEIRQLISGTYRILFEVDDDQVRVLHVRHSARTPLKPKTKK